LPNREWHPVFVTAVKEALADAGECQEKVRRLTDTGALDRLLEHLFTAASKEEVQAVIQETLAETTGFSPMQ